VAKRGWIKRPISVSNVAQKFSFGRPISLKTLIYKCLEPQNIISLKLEKKPIFPDGQYSNPGLNTPETETIKIIRNKNQFQCQLGHEDITKLTPPEWWEWEFFEPGQAKAGKFTGMKVKGRWKGNYMGSGQMPEALIFEIEI
jgi:hypothetical protein